jgi:hypothetical protein
MIEISTQETNSIPETDPKNEDLSSVEQLFYSSIKPDLDAMLEDPKQESINKIMNYSKSIG